jgi:hypothetical protein
MDFIVGFIVLFLEYISYKEKGKVGIRNGKRAGRRLRESVSAFLIPHSLS